MEFMRGPDGEADCQGEDSAGAVLLEFIPGHRFTFTDAFSAGWSAVADQLAALAEGVDA